MTQTAVTPDAPAVSTDREPSSHFMPSDKNYRLTGEMPKEEDLEVAGTQIPKEEKPSQDEASAASQKEPANSTQEEKVEEKGPAESKTAQTSESRWAKITRENKELRDRLSRLEGATDAKRETKQDSQPAAKTEPEAGKGRAEPKPEDVDDKGKPKYATWDDYQRDLRKWDREEAQREWSESSAKTAKEQEAQQVERTIAEGFVKKLQDSQKKYSDFEAVALNPDLLIPKRSAVDIFLLESDNPGEVLYYLGQHPEIMQGFYKDHNPQTGQFTNLISPVAQLRQLAKIELDLAADAKKAETPPVKPVTSAPRPPNQVSGKGTVARDAVEQAVQDNDTESYIREQNARALARRKQGK